jgi:hypothetical protein
LFHSIYGDYTRRLGGAARGIAFFGDNDQDWISAAPVYQILRDTAAGTITLVVNLISPHAVPAGGAVITRTRNLIFGIMASPAKPQNVAPVRTAREWWPADTPTENQVGLEFLGADYYWGTQTPCLQYYPFQHNYSIFDWLVNVRKTGTVGNISSAANIPMDRTHNYAISWIREQWMPLL